MSKIRKFKKVAVLMGGPSREREVSLRSGAAVAKGLRACGYAVEEVDIGGLSFTMPADVDAAFIALHGALGEDGQIQQVLEERGIPYVGTKADKMPLSFDKVTTKRILDAKGLPTAPYEIVRAAPDRTLPLPVVIKPPQQGSSIGVHKVTREADWEPAISDALSYQPDVLVEKFIEGRELTAGILGQEVLPLIEIRAPQGQYDFKAKYTKGMTEYLVPAPISAEVTNKCREHAWAVFQALECKDLGRVDFMMTFDGELFILELNSIPGFTETSLLPKAAQCAGITFPQLCGRLMEWASL